jgi:hypothetical protein
VITNGVKGLAKEPMIKSLAKGKKLACWHRVDCRSKADHMTYWHKCSLETSPEAELPFPYHARCNTCGSVAGVRVFDKTYLQ